MEKVYRAQEGCGMEGNIRLIQDEDEYIYAESDLRLDSGNCIQGRLALISPSDPEYDLEAEEDRDYLVLVWDGEEDGYSFGDNILIVQNMTEEMIQVMLPEAFFADPDEHADRRTFTLLSEE